MIVTLYKPEFIEKQRGRLFVVKTDDYGQIEDISRVCNTHNKLHTIVLTVNEPFSLIPFREEWKNIPIYLVVPEMGSFRDVAAKLNIIHQFKIRVFLNTDHKHTYTNLRILSSIGIPCGIHFGKIDPDWDVINDLMYYSVYGKVKHASIEPFEYVTSQYKPDIYTDFSAVYFNDPHQSVHMNEFGKIALTAEDLVSNKFITDIEHFDSIEQNPLYKEGLKRWQQFFLDNHLCSYCPAWRVCLGKFADKAEVNSVCKKFFSDLMDAADYYRLKQQKGTEVWQ